MNSYSVLMTVYNGDNPDYFALSLDSMLNQTLSPEEIVIVKDGAINDKLQDVINQRLNGNIKINQVQLEKNVGLGLALNEGIKVITSELIARMDADDYSLPERCELQVKEFFKNPELDIVGYPVDEFVDDPDNVVGKRDVPLTNDEIYKYAKRRDPFNHPTVMYKKKTVESVGGYSDYRKNQDTDLWIRMLQNNAICLNIDKRLFRFRFDSGTYKKRKSWINTKILIKIRYDAWKSGFNSFFDFFVVAISQMGVYVLPVWFQKFLYKTFLRR